MAFYELSGMRSFTNGPLAPRPFQATFEAADDHGAAEEARRRKGQHAGLRYEKLTLARLEPSGRVTIPI